MSGRYFEDWTVGDTIAHPIRRTVTETRASESRPLAGIVTFAHHALNQRDEVVCTCLRTALIQRRPQ